MAFLLFSHYSSALVARAAIRAPTFTVSAYTGDATGFPYVGRDGGGGGVVDGKNVIVYSDTTTTNAAGGFVNFSSNSYAFVPDPREPLKLQDFGSPEKTDVPTEVVPWYGTEACSTNYIWPNSRFGIAEQKHWAFLTNGVRARSFRYQIQRSHCDAGLCHLQRWEADFRR